MIGIAKAEAVRAGSRVGTNGRAPAAAPGRAAPVANCALAIAVKDHKDEVRLSVALNRLVEEDPGLSWGPNETTRET